MGLFSWGKSKPRVLVADDDDSMRAMISTALEGAGYAVEAVVNGGEAFERLSRGVYALAVLDHQMPRMTGLQVLEALSSAGRSGRTPVLMLTAESRPAVVDKALAYRIAGYVIKQPFDLARFLARVKNILDGPAAPGSAPPP